MEIHPNNSLRINENSLRIRGHSLRIRGPDMIVFEDNSRIFFVNSP